MRTRRELNAKLQEVRSTVLAAVAELDLRGTDQRFTEAMCVVEEAFDAAVAGKSIRPNEIARRGMAKSDTTEILRCAQNDNRR
jgi:hypothetical protein